MIFLNKFNIKSRIQTLWNVLEVIQLTSNLPYKNCQNSISGIIVKCCIFPLHLYRKVQRTGIVNNYTKKNLTYTYHSQGRSSSISPTIISSQCKVSCSRRPWRLRVNSQYSKPLADENVSTHSVGTNRQLLCYYQTAGSETTRHNGFKKTIQYNNCIFYTTLDNLKEFRASFQWNYHGPVPYHAGVLEQPNPESTRINSRLQQYKTRITEW